VARPAVVVERQQGLFGPPRTRAPRARPGRTGGRGRWAASRGRCGAASGSRQGRPVALAESSRVALPVQHPDGLVDLGEASTYRTWRSPARGSSAGTRARPARSSSALGSAKAEVDRNAWSTRCARAARRGRGWAVLEEQRWVSRSRGHHDERGSRQRERSSRTRLGNTVSMTNSTSRRTSRCERSSRSRAITRPPTSTPEGKRRSRSRATISRRP
jgi:hypothetical protein